MPHFNTFIVLLLCHTLTAQTISLTEIAALPSQIGESSGLIYTNNGTLWTHNDGGNSSELFAFSSIGAYERTLTINALNNDWEDLAQDAQQNVYIGDFGNNANNRIDLTIYKMAPPDIISSTTTSPIGVIQFHFPDQTVFPPSDRWKNFDVEAFIAAGDSLYLFTKNRTVPYSSITKLYRIPQAPGNYTAQLIDSFDTTEPNASFIFSVTGADISPDGKSLVLCAAHKLWLFTNFPRRDFFKGDVQELSFDIFTQKEGVCFGNDGHTLYLSDEHNSTLGGGKLYHTDIANYLATTSVTSALMKDVSFKLHRQDEQCEVILTLAKDTKLRLMRTNLAGQQKLLLKETTLTAGTHRIAWTNEETEFVSLYINNQLVKTEKISY